MKACKYFLFLILFRVFAYGQGPKEMNVSRSLSFNVTRSNEINLADSSLPVQEDKPIAHKFSIEGSFGYGFPMGIYGSKGTTVNNYYTNFYDYYADPGIHFEAGLNDKISQNWGVNVEVHGNVNRFDINSSQPFFRPIGAIFDIVSGGTYYFGEYMAGPYYYGTFNNGNVFEGKIIIGIVNLNQAPISVKNPSYTYPGTSVSGVGVSAGVKYKIHIGQKLFITIGTEYSIADVDQALIPDNRISFANSLIELFSGSAGLEYKL